MEHINPNTKIAAYPRVSTEEQRRKGLSIEAQTNELRRWAERNNLKIVDFYNDAGHSARKKYDKRPEMLRLLEDVKAGKIDLIIFTKLDRWFRNISEYYKVQEILEANGVQWKAIHEDYDTTTASGRLKINIMLSVAQDEADRDSERIKAVFQTKREKGEPVSGSVPTGYKLQGKMMVKDEAWEPVIDSFFKAFLELQSIRAARDRVLEECQTEISYQMANLFLKKTAYYGLFNGVAGMCPPYITKEQFDRIQSLRKKVVRKTKYNRVYLFCGTIRCGVCGNRMAASANRVKKADGSIKESYRYKCDGKYVRSNCDNSVNINEGIVESFLLSHVDPALENFVAKATAERSARKSASIAPKRAAVKKKLSKLKDLYINDLIDLELYRKDYDDLSRQLAALEPVQMPSEVQINRLKNYIHDGWKDAYSALEREGKQSFWRKVLDSVVVNSDRSIDFSFSSIFVD